MKEHGTNSTMVAGSKAYEKDYLSSVTLHVASFQKDLDGKLSLVFKIQEY